MTWNRTSSRIHNFLFAIAVITFSSAELRAAGTSFESCGVKIHYEVRGAGEPVVLIHGFAMNGASQWVLPGVVKTLAKDYQVITVDSRGHGQSGKPHDPKQYGILMVDDVARLLDHLEIKKAHVIGYSMGGLITLKFVTKYPDRVLSATLGGMGLLHPTREPVLVELADSLDKARGFAPLLRWLHPPRAPKPSEGQIEFADKFLRASNDMKAMAAVVRSSMDPDLDISETELKAVKVPMLAIVGALDPFRTKVDALKSRYPSLQVVVVPDGDHFNTVFKPKFLGTVRPFLAEHRQTNSASD